MLKTRPRYRVIRKLWEPVDGKLSCTVKTETFHRKDTAWDCWYNTVYDGLRNNAMLDTRNGNSIHFFVITQPIPVPVRDQTKSLCVDIHDLLRIEIVADRVPVQSWE